MWNNTSTFEVLDNLHPSIALASFNIRISDTNTKNASNSELFSGLAAFITELGLSQNAYRISRGPLIDTGSLLEWTLIRSFTLTHASAVVSLFFLEFGFHGGPSCMLLLEKANLRCCFLFWYVLPSVFVVTNKLLFCLLF